MGCVARLARGALSLLRPPHTASPSIPKQPPAAPTAAARQLVPPDPAQQRRIVDCAAAYVDCANAALYGPCCGKAVPEDSQDAAAAKAFETKSPTDGANRRRLRASPLRRRLAAGGVAPGDLLL